MKNKKLILMVLLPFLLLLPSVPLAEERATRAEIIEKCNEAAALVLAEGKEAAIALISDPQGRFVWKDTYVFLMDFDGNILAHPVIPQLMQKGPLLDLVDKNKVKPKKIIVEFINIAKTNSEGWIWYRWPKPNSREDADKFTFIKRVGFTDMAVGAGMHR